MLESIDSLTNHRLRLSLSLIGIAIGIASIVVVISISTSGKDAVYKELETFGLKTIWIYRSFDTKDNGGEDYFDSGISTGDFKALLSHNLPDVKLISPVFELGSSVASTYQTAMPVKLLGVDENYIIANREVIKLGRFFDLSDIQDRENVAVISTEVALRLFPNVNNSIGHVFAVNDAWFSVIGVLGEKNRELISSLGAGGGATEKVKVLIPFTSRLKLVGNGYPMTISYIQGQAVDSNKTSVAIDSIVQVLSQRNGDTYEYTGTSMSSYAKTADNIIDTVSLIGTISAMVSIVVGGLAVMNTMIMSVMERTKEIGIRRAIGATKNIIKAQFLIESTVISLAAGPCK